MMRIRVCVGCELEAVNIEQRPGSHPIMNYLCPTLLRGSSMWLIQKNVPLTGEAGHEFQSSRFQVSLLFELSRVLSCLVK